MPSPVRNSFLPLHFLLLTLSPVAKKREEMAFQPLRPFVIDVISATEASVDSEDAAVLRTAKMSSTYIREWIVKNQGAKAGPTS